VGNVVDAQLRVAVGTGAPVGGSLHCGFMIRLASRFDLGQQPSFFLGCARRRCRVRSALTHRPRFAFDGDLRACHLGELGAACRGIVLGGLEHF
jgi:hypothetical protein